MKIGIDLSTIDKNKAGVGYFAYSLTKAMLEQDKDNQYFLYTNNIGNIEEFSIYQNAFLQEIREERGGFSWIIRVSKKAREETDTFLSLANFTFSILNRNTIQIVHDLAPIRYPHFFPTKGSISYRIQLELAVRFARKIITPLEAVRQELITTFPKQVSKFSAVGAGLHEWTRISPNPEHIELIKRKYNLPDKYILTTGTLEPRKNHVNMIRAFKSFSRINPDYFFAVIGKKGWFYDELFTTVRKLGLDNKIIFLGYIPEEDLSGVYANAKAFAFCSFYEGFGFPPLEAASFNLPILCSNIDAMREIFKDKVEYADPNSPSSIAKGFRSIIHRESVDYSDVIHKYTWEDTAARVIKSIVS